MQDKDEEQQPFLGGDKKKDNDLEFRVSGRGMLVWGCGVQGRQRNGN